MGCRRVRRHDAFVIKEARGTAQTVAAHASQRAIRVLRLHARGRAFGGQEAQNTVGTHTTMAVANRPHGFL